jgi:3-oxoacyl-[acyl-carrier-protein] synthase-3
MKIEGVDIEAIFGGVPSNIVDNIAQLSELVGEEKAQGIVKATGFTTRRVASKGQDVIDLVLPAAKCAIEGVDLADIGGVISVSFSNRDRFPALSTRLQHLLGLPTSTIAYDISMACSGWIYGLYAAAQLVHATGKKVLLADGDVQSTWTDNTDPNTLAVMGDGASATLLAPGNGVWDFDFYTDGSGADALRCHESIHMDGFGVFRFVAGPVRKFLSAFIQSSELLQETAPAFVPHQANMYMVRQLSEAIGLKSSVFGSGAKYANTGSCSAALTMADGIDIAFSPSKRTPILFAGFGAGLSAAAAATTISSYRKGVVEV